MTNIMLSALVFGLGYVTALYKLSLLLLLLLLRDEAAAEEAAAGVAASGNIRIAKETKRGIVRLVGGWVVAALF